MKTKLRRKIALFLGATLMFCSLGQGAWAQTITSATAPSSILLGESLTVRVTVLNDSMYDWESGWEYEYSWATEIYSPNETFVSGAGSYSTVYADDTASLSVTLTPNVLPSSAGNYFIDVDAYYNYFDLGYYYMNNSHVRVYFTINAANHAPVITAIPDKVVVDTNLLSFTVSASDSDTGQTLSYALLSGAPAGAGINASSGLFTWSPPAGYAPATNQISVKVTDNGSPAMSATNTFKVIVINPLRFHPPAKPINGAVRLVWDSYPGKTYRVRYRDNLVSGPYTYIEILATDWISTITNVPPGTTQRYYQLMLMD